MTSHRQGPGPQWRRNATGETSEAAARYMAPKAPRLRDQVLAAIELQPATPEEIQARLKASGVHHLVSAIRPRCTELKGLGLICDSGQRGVGESGRCKSVVWRATTADERAAFAATAADASGQGGQE